MDDITKHLESILRIQLLTKQSGGWPPEHRTHTVCVERRELLAFLRALSASLHVGNNVTIAVTGRCSSCAHTVSELALPAPHGKRGPDESPHFNHRPTPTPPPYELTGLRVSSESVVSYEQRDSGVICSAVFGASDHATNQRDSMLARSNSHKPRDQQSCVPGNVNAIFRARIAMERLLCYQREFHATPRVREG